MTVRREASFELPMDAEALADSVPALLAGLQFHDIHREGLTIIARRGLNWRSFGEHIRVSLTPSTPGNTRVKVESASVIVTTVVDWGSGTSNVRRIQAALTEAAAASAST